MPYFCISCVLSFHLLIPLFSHYCTEVQGRVGYALIGCRIQIGYSRRGGHVLQQQRSSVFECDPSD